MKARYWPWRGVPAVPTGPASLCDTSASLCGERSGSVRESPGERPAEGVGLDTVPMSDEAEDIVTEGRHALEAAVTQDAPLQDAEPNLDLVDPGGMQRSVDKVQPVAVLLVEPRPAGVAAVVVQVEVVPDDVDPTTLVARPTLRFRAVQPPGSVRRRHEVGLWADRPLKTAHRAVDARG